MKSRFNINGRELEIEFTTSDCLLDVLRHAGFNEVKEGCKEGECGSCLVLVNGKAVNSCKVFAASVVGQKILTIKGIGQFENPHPLQVAFVDSGAVQCGYCTPGMILATYELLNENRDPSEEEIKMALDGNLCRCTGYVKIIDAVKLAVARMADHG